MTILLTGGTGLIGQALGKKLTDKNYKIHLLSRRINPQINYPANLFLWKNETEFPPEKSFPKNEPYGIIHLMGESINQWPWSKKTKQRIFSSRVESTKNLISTLLQQKQALTFCKFFLSMNAVGIYGDHKDNIITEACPLVYKEDSLFLEKLCQSWEDETLRAMLKCRTLIFRAGVVMSKKGGFLHQHLKLLKTLKVIPKLISKRKLYLSWIHIDDLTDMILWAIENENAKGIYNACSPNPVTFKNFYTILLSQRNCKGFGMPIPLFIAKWLAGEMIKNLSLSIRAIPQKALLEGFIFKKANIKKAM